MKDLNGPKVRTYVLGMRPLLEKKNGDYYIHFIVANWADEKDVHYIRASTSYNGNFLQLNVSHEADGVSIGIEAAWVGSVTGLVGKPAS